MFSFWHVPSSLQMQQGKTKGDVTLIYSLVKNWAITLKRKSEEREYEKNDYNGGFIVCLCVCVCVRMCVHVQSCHKLSII